MTDINKISKEIDKVLLDCGVAGDTTRRCLVLALVAWFLSCVPEEIKPMKGIATWKNRDLKLSHGQLCWNQCRAELLRRLEGNNETS